MNNNAIVHKPPLLVLAAGLSSKLVVDDFFNTEGVFYKLIKDPKYLRYTGWNLLTLDQPKIREGNSWEVRNGDRKTIRLYRDGSLVCVAYADNSFLGWGQGNKEFQNNPRLNTLAVIEYIYEFVEFYRNFLNLTSQHTGEIIFRLSIKNSQLENGNKLRLTPTKVKDLFYSSFKGGELEKDFTRDIREALSESIYDSRFISFKLIAELFLAFNIPTDKIPYTKLDSVQRRYVDIDDIKSNM